MRLNVPISVGAWGRFFSRWDVLAVLLILGLLVFLAEASRHLLAPLAELQRRPVSLDAANLPEYAAPVDKSVQVTGIEHDIAVPFRIKTTAGVVSFFSMTTVFGTPVDVMLSEIALELFFPADAETATSVQRMVADGQAN